jgi:hypothetical protein
MSALTKTKKRFAREPGQRRVMGHDLHVQPGQQRIQWLSRRTVAGSARDNHSGFLEADRRHRPWTRRQDSVNETIFLWLTT